MASVAAGSKMQIFFLSLLALISVVLFYEFTDESENYFAGESPAQAALRRPTRAIRTCVSILYKCQ